MYIKILELFFYFLIWLIVLHPVKCISDCNEGPASELFAGVHVCQSFKEQYDSLNNQF